MKNTDPLKQSMKKSIWTGIFALYAGIIFYASIYPVQSGAPLVSVPGMDKVVHAGEFTAFALIGYRTLIHYVGRAKSYLAVAIVSLFYGGLTELTQLFIPYRSASAVDWVADLIGVAIGLIILIFFRRWKAKYKQTNSGTN